MVIYAAFGVFVVGTIYTVVQLALGPGRYVRRDLLPKLARGLRPLAPMDTEISAALEKCKTAGMKIGKKIKLEQIHAALKTAPAE